MDEIFFYFVFINVIKLYMVIIVKHLKNVNPPDPHIFAAGNIRTTFLIILLYFKHQNVFVVLN